MIRSLLAHRDIVSDLRDLVPGAIGGIVTTFAVVSGVSGALFPGGVAIIRRWVNLIADGFSMGVNNSLGSQAEQQQRQRVCGEEKLHVQIVPEGG